MVRAIRATHSMILTGLVLTSLVACGAASIKHADTQPATTSTVATKVPKSADAVARIGNYVVTKSAINQWMMAEIGEDFKVISKRQAPSRLVSEPPNYGACVTTLAASSPRSGRNKPPNGGSSRQLKTKCESLYRAIKARAVTFLVGAYWTLDFARHHGLSVSTQEVDQKLKRVRATQYPKPGEFEASLKLRSRTLSQERFLAKLELTQQLLVQRTNGSDAKAAGLAKEAKSSENSAACRGAYTVAHCAGFNGQGYSGPAPLALLEEIVASYKA